MQFKRSGSNFLLYFQYIYTHTNQHQQQQNPQQMEEKQQQTKQQQQNRSKRKVSEGVVAFCTELPMSVKERC